MATEEVKTKPGDAGTCGFCGTGEGYLGDQGDEGTQYLHSAVRSEERDENGQYSYTRHPHARPDPHDPSKPGQRIIWCGNCLGGLKHKFQRYDDHNLSAEHKALQFWLELDGPRWSGWGSEDREVTENYRDDPAIHMDKLHRERRVADIQNELFRRAGFDLTSRGWRE